MLGAGRCFSSSAVLAAAARRGASCRSTRGSSRRYSRSAVVAGTAVSRSFRPIETKATAAAAGTSGRFLNRHHRRAAAASAGAFFSTAHLPQQDASSNSSKGGVVGDQQHHQHPPLKEIPSLPVFGSLVSAYSGIPAFNPDKFDKFWRNLHKEYGPFYSVGVPSFGSGLRGTLHVVRDPAEMLKVLRQEGTYPSGIVEKEWPLINWMERKKYSSVALLSRGKEWKRIRSFIQKDLLAPASAKEYLGGILKGAEKASAKAPLFAEQGNYNRFLNFAAMDMFAEILFGGEKGLSEEDYQTFCRAAVDGLAEIFAIMRAPLEAFAGGRLGLETPRVRRVYQYMDTLDEIARRRVRAFTEQVEKGDLTEEERNSYFHKLMMRQPDSDVTEEEMIESAVVIMIAAVDTTAAKMAWNVVQLALNQEVQRELYEQIDAAVQKEGGLTPAVFERNDIPLLQAFIRETHRCTPPLFGDIMKEVSVPTEVYGVTLPAGSSVMFDCLTNQWDPELVEDPMAFKPERWYKDAVEARKGTPAAIIDHPFYSGPFSQGARRCPGSRVAYLEVQAMIARLLLDWKIEGPGDMHWKDVEGKLQTLFVPVFPEGVRFVPRK